MLTDPAIKEMTDEEEQVDDDESTDGEQGTSVESRVSTRNLRHSERGRKPFKHSGQHIYDNDHIYL